MEKPTFAQFPSPQPRKVYSVTQVNKIAKDTLENFSAWVHGEITDLEKIKTRFESYFLKFKLKDEVTGHILPVISWNEAFENLDFELKNGVAIVIFGNLTLWEKTGSYQFVAKVIELYGEGLLAKKFEELKAQLRKQGFFDEARKKPIPAYPVKIGVVTSSDSAAWIDFKKHTIDKFPFFEIVLADVFVQGEQAISDIVWALERLNQEDLAVIVITRGGGSLEDLAAFNSEEVALVIAASKIPTISAIGHERDETIAAWVADIKCSTPTAAAKLITAGFEEFLAKMPEVLSTLTSQATKFYQTKLLEVSLLEKELIDGVKNFINANWQALNNFDNNLKKLPLQVFAQISQKLQTLSRELELLSPQQILNRGYSITYKLPKMQILTTAQNIAPYDKITIRLAKGKLTGEVLTVEKN